MARRELRAQRLIALFVLGWMLFSFPLLSLFNTSDSVLGIPVLYAYLFGVWVGFIGLIAALTTERRS